MKPWELLGLSEQATEAELRRALEAARNRWSRRRDVATTADARARAEAALARLADIAASLGAPVPEATQASTGLHSGPDLDILAELARQREMARHEEERRLRSGSRRDAPVERMSDQSPPMPNPEPTAPEEPREARTTPVIRRAPTRALEVSDRSKALWLLPALAAGLVAFGLLARPDLGPAPDAGRTTLPAPRPSASPETLPAKPTTLPRAVRAPRLSGADALLADGARAWQQGRAADALTAFEAAAKAGANPAVADVGRALALIGLNRHKDAEASCRRAIKRVPGLAAAHYNLGVALHRQGRSDEAAAAFRSFLKLAPGDPAAPRARGYLARKVLRRRPLVTRPTARD
ncbi:MAG: tetratricopeptide repeat protein [Candidatus Sericytochromatia bacterium]|nr:tetratricopeptide repeat protein [Candidatus Sericytochromatia bacterium]